MLPLTLDFRHLHWGCWQRSPFPSWKLIVLFHPLRSLFHVAFSVSSVPAHRCWNASVSVSVWHIRCVVREHYPIFIRFDQVSFGWTCSSVIFESMCQRFTGTLSWMLRFPGVKLYRQAFTETICMQLEYARMKCLSKAFCIHRASLCVSSLNRCTLNRLLEMFVLLPTATISRYKMTFIFLMCAYTHTVLCAHLYAICLFSPMTALRVIMPWRTTALCSMKWNSETGNNQGRAAARDNSIQQQSFVTANCCAEGLGSPGKVCCRWEPCLWKLSRFQRLLATLKHLKFFILDTILLLHCSLGCRSNLYLSPVTDDLIELRVKWSHLHLADKDTS